MKTEVSTVTTKGQLVIPAKLRRKYSIKEGTKWPSSKRKIVSFSNRSLRNLFAVSAAASAKTPRLRKFSSRSDAESENSERFRP